MKNPKGRPDSLEAEIIHLTPETMAVDELEERIETALIPFPEVGATGRFFPNRSSSGPCDCFSTLCQCDGHDCVGVCAVHCMVHYV